MRKLSLNELKRVDIDSYKQQEKTTIVVVLDNVRSASNVGSFFRTIDSFGLEKLILCGVTAHPPHKEITKTAIGSTQSVDWSYVKNIEQTLLKLKAEGYEIIAIEQTSHSELLNEYTFPHKKIVLIFGNEITGVSDTALALSDTALEIPQFGTKHSLNVSVCGGIVLWEFKKMLSLRPLIE